jgi:1-acyl-sn-glycerol-3-phosphate acyltransferase
VFFIASSFLLILPFFYLFLSIKKTYRWAHFMNHFWASVALRLCFITIEFEGRENISPRGSTAIYCSNHSSYFDIPTIFRAIVNDFSIVGKASLNTIPFFGYMFRKLYVPVQRNSKRGIQQMMDLCSQKLDSGQSIVFYPEGTIPDTQQPQMIPFKDGAFKLAIAKQIPIIPITIPFNWIILPIQKSTITWHRMKIIFHQPIPTKGLTDKDIKALKNQTFEVINNELIRQNQ